MLHESAGIPVFPLLIDLAVIESQQGILSQVPVQGLVNNIIIFIFLLIPQLRSVD